MPRPFVSLAVSAAAATALVVGGPAVASSASGHQHHALRATKAYTRTFSSEVEHGRVARNLHAYSNNRHLKKIALNWAKHLAKTGLLIHNPNLLTKVTNACPRWTSAGENVGTSETSSAKALYEAYMHSPPHRANILNRGYTQVGIATVSITKNGQTSYWNVMDFGAGCPK